MRFIPEIFRVQSGTSCTSLFVPLIFLSRAEEHVEYWIHPTEGFASGEHCLEVNTSLPLGPNLLLVLSCLLSYLFFDFS